MIDKNGSGKIDYEEFMKWYQTEDRFGKLHLDEKQMEAIQRATAYFKYFDKDSSGSVNRSEFEKLHADLVKNRFTTHSLEDCLATLDANNDGQVQFNEYMDWLKNIGSL